MAAGISLTDDEIEEIREIFSHFDADGNGVIEYDEFGALLRALDETIGEDEIRALGDILLYPRPILVHGGAWEKTERYIGTYGDVHADLAWTFLTADLCAGTEFAFDITIPETQGISARCRVLGVTSVRTEMGAFNNGLDCLYLVDLGVMEYEGTHGVTGYARHITYGRVIYVPDVGPVYSYERFLVCVTETLSAGSGDMELNLVNTGKVEPE